MRRIKITAILLVLLIGIFSSCSKKEFVIKGIIKGIEFDKVSLVPMTDYDEITSGDIDIDGSFVLSVKDVQEGEYKIKFSDSEQIPVYIGKTGEVTLDINYQDYMFQTTYKGDFSEESTFINTVTSKEDDILSRFSVNISNYDISEIINAFDNLSKDLTDIFETDSTKNAALLQIYKELVQYKVALAKLDYETTQRYLTDSKSYQIPQGFNDYKSSININQPSLVEYKDYIEFIRLFFRFDITQQLLEKQGKYNVAEYCESYVNEFKSKNVPNRAKEIVLYTGFKFFMNDLITLKADSLILAVTKDMSNSEFKADLKAIYDKAKTTDYVLSGGVQAPVWRAIDMNGKEMSLESFKGHYVFVEVWATWCAPCIQEMPYFTSLASKYKSKNINFISLSIDTNIESWKTFLKDRNSEVIDLINTDGYKAKFMSEYAFNGVPQFMLFDPLGRVVDVHMPYPSKKITSKILDDLLN